MTKIRRHYLPENLQTTTEPITISVIGCGGTGSRIINALAEMNYTLKKLNHQGIHLTAYDPDTVSEPNIGRQKFFDCDLDNNKAQTLITRINRAYGYDWKAIPQRFEGSQPTNFYISCVDSLKSRLEIKNCLSQIQTSYHYHHKPYYLIDFGNDTKTAQYFISTLNEIPQPNVNNVDTATSLPDIFNRYPHLETTTELEKDQHEPSCSMAEAIRKQALYINAALIPFALQQLMDFLLSFELKYAGAFISLEQLKTQPIVL